MFANLLTDFIKMKAVSEVKDKVGDKLGDEARFLIDALPLGQGGFQQKDGESLLLEKFSEKEPFANIFLKEPEQIKFWDIINLAGDPKDKTGWERTLLEGLNQYGKTAQADQGYNNPYSGNEYSNFWAHLLGTDIG